MFEKIILKSSDSGQPITLGELAEALLFYQNVHIILDYSSLSKIVSSMGMEKLLSLLSRQNVSAVYYEDSLGTQTQKFGAIEAHSFMSFMLSGDQAIGQLKKRKDRLEFILMRLGYDKRQARTLMEQFRRKVPIRKLNDNYFIEGGILNAAWQDLSDATYIQEATKLALIKQVGSNYPLTNYRFEVDSHFPNFYIKTNIDFIDLNNKLKQINHSYEDITPAQLINNILVAKADTILAANYGGEFFTSALSSEIIQLRYIELLKRINIDKKELNIFKEISIPNSPSIKEIINSGERSFDEFLSLLDKSSKFREWVHGINPDEKIATAYLNEVNTQSWANKGPTKTLRYILSTAIGAIEPISGAAYSAADTFILEKFFGGWRPSHFINEKLKPFLSTE